MADVHTQPARIAIVTGASRGIGRSVALRLAADGLDVAINDISANETDLNRVAEDIRAHGRRAVTYFGDVSEEDVVRDLVDSTVKELGGVDVMIANAGIGMSGTITEMDVAQWDRLIAVNIRGPMLAYKYAGRQMIKQGRGGRLIAASSILGKKGSSHLSAYCASKFAVRGLTQSAAMEFGPHKITVNTYAPGMINTQIIRSTHDNGNDGAILRKITGWHEATIGEPEMVASLVSFLAKPESHFITGQSINVDGGVQFD